MHSAKTFIGVLPLIHGCKGDAFGQNVLQVTTTSLPNASPLPDANHPSNPPIQNPQSKIQNPMPHPLLTRYAQGERDFSGANLRGGNFKGQNLSGANLSGADIRGANFAGATLMGVNFSGAKAGLQMRWVVGQLVASFVLIAVIQFVGAELTGMYLAFSIDKTVNFALSSEQPIKYAARSVTEIIITVGMVIAIAREGFTRKLLGTVALVGTIAATVAVIVAIVGSSSVAVAISGAILIAVAVTAAIPFASAVVGAGVGADAVASAVTIAGVFIAIGAFAAIFAAFSVSAAIIVGGAFAVSLAGLGTYVARHALKGDPKFFVIRSFGLAFGALGGTSFYKADLTDANFSHAQLKSTNFRAATLTRTCFKDALKLDRARPGDTILADLNVLKLLTTLNGYRQSYIDADLRGANLSGANLEGANFKWADLSGATLKAANLKEANLTETLCIDADFTHAYLTGACLQGWNIDHTTVLDHVDCQFVFLLEHPDEMGSRERRPHSPDKVFQPGDFEKYFKEVMDTVQLLIRHGATADDFQAAFQKVMEEYDIASDAVQAVEKKGDDMLVTVQIPPGTDKGNLERDFDEVIEARLEAARTAGLLEGERRRADSLEKALMVVGPVSQVFNVTSESHSDSKAKSDSSDSSRETKIGDVGGNLNASGSALNLGDVSGSVTNTIDQSSASPETDCSNEGKLD